MRFSLIPLPYSPRAKALPAAIVMIAGFGLGATAIQGLHAQAKPPSIPLPKSK